jgi:hypothetical protein
MQETLNVKTPNKISLRQMGINLAFKGLILSYSWLLKRICVLDVHKSLHHNINIIEITNKLRLCSRIYYSSVS